VSCVTARVVSVEVGDVHEHRHPVGDPRVSAGTGFAHDPADRDDGAT